MTNNFEMFLGLATAMQQPTELSRCSIWVLMITTATRFGFFALDYQWVHTVVMHYVYTTLVGWPDCAGGLSTDASNSSDSMHDDSTPNCWELATNDEIL